MSVALKRVCDQVIVLTGATSGIGLATARLAAQRGARLALAARNEESLRQLAEEIAETGGEALWVVADVADEAAVRRLADETIKHYGGFDTWVNNAGVSIYGTIEEVSMDDQRRLFDTNVWGLVHGSRIAAEHFRRHGGALINVGSILSDRALPLQGTYSASKHAVKGFTDALRMELERDCAPISVTLIKPSTIDTPYRRHAKNYMDVEPKNPPPVYHPHLVAEAILHAAENPVRDVIVGGGGKAISSVGSAAPRLMDWLMEWTMFDGQRTERPATHNAESLYWSNDGSLEERGGYRGHVSRTSLYTQIARHPVAAMATALGIGAIVGSLWFASDESRRHGAGRAIEGALARARVAARRGYSLLQ
jgi:short-subunit dehydrogenase